MGDLVDLGKTLEDKKFSDTCDKVEEANEAIGKIIDLSETFDPKIRVGVLMKALTVCIHDGLVSDLGLQNILEWIKGEHRLFMSDSPPG